MNKEVNTAELRTGEELKNLFAAPPSGDKPAYNNLDVPPDWSKPRVLVAMPTRGEVSKETAVSLFNMAKNSTKYEMLMYVAEGFTVSENRTKCVAVAMKDKCTHILWIDDDMGFPWWALEALMDWRVPVVGANYPRKLIPPMPTAYVDTPEYTGPLYSEVGQTGIVQVRHLGFGCVLTHMAVFEKLMATRTGDDPPFFHQEPMKGGDKWCTEDVYFAHRCAKAGIPLYVDHDLSNAVIHVGKIHYDNRWCIAGRNVNKARGLGKDSNFKKEDLRWANGQLPPDPPEEETPAAEQTVLIPV